MYRCYVCDAPAQFPCAHVPNPPQPPLMEIAEPEKPKINVSSGEDAFVE